jgi:hypothetical protein
VGREWLRNRSREYSIRIMRGSDIRKRCEGSSLESSLDLSPFFYLGSWKTYVRG